MFSVMAASASKMNVASEDSSSSDDEELKRCQEAVWETQIKKSTEEDNHVKESKRIIVADHRHDGNELQVTEGFQTHVAKKLGHYLDSCISETQHRTASCGESSKSKDEEDEDFRLFSTSIPGQKPDDPPAPPRRRPIPSSSDSDSELDTRLKEAAVSIGDLFPSSIKLTSTSPCQTETPCVDKIKKKKKKKQKVAVEGESDNETKVAQVVEMHAVKKKRKKEQEESNQEDCDVSASNSQSSGENGISQQDQVKVKRKKKKKKETNKDTEA